MKLWDKGYNVDSFVERFTTGEDYILDMRILPHDIRASKVHAEVLQKAGVLTDEELSKIKIALDELLKLYEGGKVKIKIEDEDCHTVIENFLTERLGEIGKKIHTARSRNDQVLTALRLYYREIIKDITESVKSLIASVKDFSKKYGKIQFPGFTHTRKAMPTDIKTWSEALVDSLKDDLKLLKAVMDITDQSPLGTGAGYGVPLDIDREYSAKKLGFKKVQKNPIYTQNSRGKFEGMIMHALLQISLDLNRFATDIIFLSFLGILKLDVSITTGSSIMPQKKNPDVLELVRGYHHRILSNEIFVMSIISNMIMGYHKDYQLLKKVVFETFDILIDMIRAMDIVFKKMSVDEKAASEMMDDEIFATHRVYELVKKGVPFREAYRIVAQKFKEK